MSITRSTLLRSPAAADRLPAYRPPSNLLHQEFCFRQVPSPQLVTLGQPFSLLTTFGLIGVSEFFPVSIPRTRLFLFAPFHRCCDARQRMSCTRAPPLLDICRVSNEKLAYPHIEVHKSSLRPSREVLPAWSLEMVLSPLTDDISWLSLQCSTVAITAWRERQLRKGQCMAQKPVVAQRARVGRNRV